MTYKLIDPEGDGIHPLRHELTDNDWDRLERVIVDKSVEHVSTEELEAYNDYLYDFITMKMQTHYGTTVLQ